jgi:hypothetical protein
MQDLKLIPANKHRSGGPWSDDDYDVVEIATGDTVGRIFLEPVPSHWTAPWFWGVAFPYVLNQSGYYGYAETKDAAIITFKQRWDCLPRPAGNLVSDLH